MSTEPLQSRIPSFFISEKRISKGVKANTQFLEEIKTCFLNYKNIFLNFENNHALLRHKNGREIGLTSAELMKLTAKSLTLLQENTSKYILLHKKIPQDPQFLVTRQQGCALFMGKNNKLIGSGTDGQIYHFDLLHEPVLKVAKYALEDAKKRMTKEIHFLNLLHAQSSGSLEGIQDAIQSTFCIEGVPLVHGYITSFYDAGAGTPLFSPDCFKNTVALSIIKQLFTGLSTAHAHNVYHQDIHIANLLIRRVSERWEICLADWGRAKQSDADPDLKLHDINDLSVALFELFTGVVCFNAPESVCKKTRKELIELKEECQKSGRDFSKEEDFRVGRFERERLQEIEIPEAMITLFERAINLDRNNPIVPQAIELIQLAITHL